MSDRFTSRQPVLASVFLNPPLIVAGDGPRDPCVPRQGARSLRDRPDRRGRLRPRGGAPPQRLAAGALAGGQLHGERAGGRQGRRRRRGECGGRGGGGGGDGGGGAAVWSAEALFLRCGCDDVLVLTGCAKSGAGPLSSHVFGAPRISAAFSIAASAPCRHPKPHVGSVPTAPQHAATRLRCATSPAAAATARLLRPPHAPPRGQPHRPRGRVGDREGPRVGVLPPRGAKDRVAVPHSGMALC